MKKAIFLSALTASSLAAAAQQFPSPAYPIPGNQYVLQWSDEFDYNIGGGATKAAQLNYLSQRWDYNYAPCSNVLDYNTNASPTKTYGENLEVSNGTLKMTVTKKPFPIQQHWDCNPDSPMVNVGYNSDWLKTWPFIHQNNQMNYGYYEMRVKLPAQTMVTYEENGQTIVQPGNRGVMFAWWQWGGTQASPYPDWMEIDFVEFSGHDDRFTHNYLYGFHGEAPPPHYPPRARNRINFNRINGTLDPIEGLPHLEEYAGFVNAINANYAPDLEGFHIISTEVTPTKVTWYLNGKFLQSTAGHEAIIPSIIPTLPCLLPMNMEIAILSNEGMDADKSGNEKDDTINAHTVLPYVVEIDYVRFYKFECSYAEDRIDEIEFPGIIWALPAMTDKVYRSIGIGPYQGWITPPRIQYGDIIALRAIEEIELLPGFEVELGGDFFADVHKCNCECIFAEQAESIIVECDEELED